MRKADDIINAVLAAAGATIASVEAERAALEARIQTLEEVLRELRRYGEEINPAYVQHLVDAVLMPKPESTLERLYDSLMPPETA